ncbi:MAG UNVERIFIED_CONTAM: hypothetical protein LVQ98_09215 [Rickettsiaceae bacterium]|jgi:hypothetical protein
MNSFKKIALAMVAAMTMSTLVATSASAAPMSVTSVKKAGVASDIPTSGTAATYTNYFASYQQITLLMTADTVEFVVTVDTGTVVPL